METGVQSTNQHQHLKEPSAEHLQHHSDLRTTICDLQFYVQDVPGLQIKHGRSCWTGTETAEIRVEEGCEEEIETEQSRRKSYAVISMVCTAACSGLVQTAPSGRVLVVLRLRTPSVEPTLEAE